MIFVTRSASRINVTRGELLEYVDSDNALKLSFEFNPQSMSRSRSVNIKLGGAPGTQGGYDFRDASETSRVAQSVTVQPETFSVEILLDATDRMNEGEPVASEHGILPELDVLRSMVEPKIQGPDGVRTLAGLGEGEGRAFQRDEYPSVLIFKWGPHTLPVFLTSITTKEVAHLPNLVPYRAEITLAMQVIEGANPFYEEEKTRQARGAGLLPENGGAP